MQKLKNIFYLSLKELRSLLGDPVMLALIVIVFSGIVYSAAKGVSTDVKNATVGIVDLDRSPLSYRIADALLSPQFEKPVEVKREEVDTLMDKGDLIFVLEFPPDFQRDLQAGRSPEVQLLVDATAMTQAGVGQAYIAQIFNREVEAFLKQSGTAEQLAPAKPVLNTLYNPNGDSAWFLGVAMVCNMVMLITLALVGAAVIREREHGTMEHLLVMPVGASEIVLSKILANGLVICTAAALSARFMLGGVISVPLAGGFTATLLLFVAGVALFMFAIGALAVMFATLAPTMPQYSLMMVPVYIVAMMFSGTTSPRSNMPEMAQQISEYWPSTQFAAFSQNVLFRGAGLETVWPQLATIALSGVLFLGYALFRFKKMLEKQG